MLCTGYPQASNGYVPVTKCNSACFSRTNAFFNDICSPNTTGAACVAGTGCCPLGSGRIGMQGLSSLQGNIEGTWTSCTAADLLKATGAKLFLVGVGLVQGHENEIQLVTGKLAWDGVANNFGTSDYLISSSFSSLTQLFAQTVTGLCQCLQAQPPCAATGTSCNAIQFTATARITTTASATSTTFAPLAVQAATVYYGYLPSPNTKIAWAFYPPAALVTETPVPQAVRTDLQLPCSVQRQITCSAGSCVQVTETDLIPRFFHESTDTAGCAGPFTVLPSPVPAATCTCYTKVYASPPYGARVPEMIQFIWVYTSDSTTPCAAQAFDGTFYEFFKDLGITYGVSGLGATPTYPVSQSTSCTAPQCASNVELVLLLDEQSSCTLQEWYAINWFALNVMSSFPVNPATRFGVAYSGSPPSKWPTSKLLSTDLKTWQNYLGCSAPTCSTDTPPSQIQAGGDSTDFAAAVETALIAFWSGPATGVRRELLTFVCGPSSSSQAGLTTMQGKLAGYGVEYWAIGVGQGTLSVSTLAALASTNNYVHYLSVPIYSALVNQQTLENQLLCPQTNLCGVNCLGFCSCASPSALACDCPQCASTFCNPATCPSSSAGCLGSQTVCNDNDACTTDSCNTLTQACLFTPVLSSCNDGNVCTTDSCSGSSGCLCEFRLRCSVEWVRSG